MSNDGVLGAVKDTQHCPKCEAQVPRIPHPRELAELAEEVRQRMIKAERTSYWRQFEQGMLGRDAVLVLIHLADTVMDTPERLIAVKDLNPYWRIPLILKKIVSPVLLTETHISANLLFIPSASMVTEGHRRKDIYRYSPSSATTMLSSTVPSCQLCSL